VPNKLAHLSFMLFHKAVEIKLRPLSCVNSKGMLRYWNCSESCKKTTTDRCLLLFFGTKERLQRSPPSIYSSLGSHLALGHAKCDPQNLCILLRAVYLDMGYLTVSIPYSVLSNHLSILQWII
jgi:hypothetical protein